MTDAEAWEAIEAEWWGSDQRRVDRVRVRGYTISVCIRVERAAAELERKVTIMLRARADAERALSVLRAELEHADLMARAVALDDAATNETLALSLERLEEVA